MTEPRRTELGQHIKGKGVGITYIFLGIFGALASLSLYGLFPVFAIIFVIIGIIILFSGIAILSNGGARKAVCPYCRQDVVIFEKAKTYKCEHCKKISTRHGNYLETIE